MFRADEPVEIRGLIVPSQWDEDGRVLTVVLNAFDESSYLLEPGQAGGDLRAYLRREVLVTGLIEPRPGGLQAMVVDRLKVLDR